MNVRTPPTDRERELLSDVTFTAGFAAWLALLLASERLDDHRNAWAVLYLLTAVMFAGMAVASWRERRRS
jgi:hypothetical protein